MRTLKKKVFFVALLFVLAFFPFVAYAAEGLPELITPDLGVLYSLGIVAAVIAADTLFGVILGVKNKQFEFRRLPQFVATGVLPYLGGLLILAGLGYVVPAVGGLYYVSAAFIAAKYLGELVEKIKAVFGVDLNQSEQLPW